jgi:hypothetical protein
MAIAANKILFMITFSPFKNMESPAETDRAGPLMGNRNGESGVAPFR